MTGERVSVQGDVASFLQSIAQEPNKDIRMDPGNIALQVGVSRDKVNRVLNNLTTRKRLVLLRGDNGRDIVGFRMLEAPPDRRYRDNREDGEAQPKKARTRRLPPVGQHPVEVEASEAVVRPHRTPRRGVYTPVLDKYAASKARFTRLTEELGDLIEARFKEDALAEEALALRERLNIIEEQLHEWRTRAESAEAEARSLRTRHMQAVERKAAEAGAMVVHSED